MLPTTGPISFANVQNEFGGDAPTAMNEYYSGGGHVSPGAAGALGLIPTIGKISLAHFRGSSGSLLTGARWVLRTTLAEGKIVNNNGTLVSIGTYANKSTDGGYNWIRGAKTLPINPVNGQPSVISGVITSALGALWDITGSTVLRSMDDGSTWETCASTQPTPTMPHVVGSSIIYTYSGILAGSYYGSPVLVAKGTSYSLGNLNFPTTWSTNTWTSLSGDVWQRSTIYSGSSPGAYGDASNPNDLVYVPGLGTDPDVGGLFVLFGSVYSSVYTSPTGILWAAKPLTNTAGSLYQGAFPTSKKCFLAFKQKFIAVADNGYTAISSDGETFTVTESCVLPNLHKTSPVVYGVASCGTYLLAVYKGIDSVGTTCAYSMDGVSWTARPSLDISTFGPVEVGTNGSCWYLRNGSNMYVVPV